MHFYDKQNNTCEKIFKNEKDVFYQAYYKVTVEQEKLDQSEMKCQIHCVLKDHMKIKNGICSYFERILSGVNCCYLPDLHYQNEVKNLTHHEYLIWVIFLVTVFHNPTMYVEAMSSSFEEIFEAKSLVLEPISRKAIDLIPDFKVSKLFYDFPIFENIYSDYLFNYDNDVDKCSADYKTLKIVANFFCPRIKLHSNEVQLSTSYLTKLNTKIDIDINSVVQIENDFLVCLDDSVVINSGSREQNSQTQQNDI